MALAVAEQQSGAGTTGAVTFTLAAGSAVGDLLVVIFADDYDTMADLLTPTGTAATTWTLRDSFDGGSFQSHIKTFTAPVTTAGAQTVICSVATTAEHGAGLWRIPNGAFDVANHANGTSSASHAAPTLTPATTDEIYCCLWTSDDGGSTNYTYTYPGGAFVGLTQRAVGTFGVFGFGYEPITSGAATGTRTATASTACAWAAASILIKPATPRESTDLTHVGSSAWVAPASSTTISPTYPASLQEFDVVYAIIRVKPDTATIATPANWTLVSTIAGGGAAAQGAGTGPMDNYVFKRLVPSGGLTGSQAFTITGGSSPVAHMQAYRATGTNLAYEEEITSWSVGTGSTTIGGTCSPSISIGAKDFLEITVGTPDDQPGATGLAVTGITATGMTLAGLASDPASGVINAQGNDIGARQYNVSVTAGTIASVAPVVTATSASAETAFGTVLRIRATVDSPTFVTYDGAVSLSATATLTTGADAPTKIGAVSLSVGKTLVVGAAVPNGAVALTSSASLSANGVRVLVDGAVALTSTTTLTTNGTVIATYAGATSLAVGSSLTIATPMLGAFAAVSLTASKTLVVGALVPNGAVSLTVGATLSTATSLLGAFGAVSLTVGSALTQDGIRSTAGAVSLGVTSTLVAGALAGAGAVALLAAATLVATPIPTGAGATLTVVGALSVSGTLGAFAAVALSAVKTLTVGASQGYFGLVTLTAVPVLTTTVTVRVTYGTTTFSVLSALSVGSSVTIGPGGVPLVAVGGLNVNGSGGGSGGANLGVVSTLLVNGVTVRLGATQLTVLSVLTVVAAERATLAISAGLVVGGVVVKIGAISLGVGKSLTVFAVISLPGAVSMIVLPTLAYVDIFPEVDFSLAREWSTGGIHHSDSFTPPVRLSEWATAGIHTG